MDATTATTATSTVENDDGHDIDYITSILSCTASNPLWQGAAPVERRVTIPDRTTQLNGDGDNDSNNDGEHEDG